MSLEVCVQGAGRVGVSYHAGPVSGVHKVESWFPTASGMNLFQNYLLAPSLWL